MADSYIELYRKLSRLMAVRAEVAGILEHPTAKGDGREDLLCEFLRERIGTAFGVSKAEVVDSEGHTTGELDCVIYDQSISSSMHVENSRRVVKVEAVAMTIEVKSRLEGEDVDEFGNNCKGLDNLTRFYEPTTFMQAMLPVLPQDQQDATRQMFRDGLPTHQRHRDVPAIVNCFFAYDGPAKKETAAKYMQMPGVEAICVLNRYTIAKANLGASLNMGRPLLYGEGLDALGAFVHVVELALQKFRASRSFVWPNAVKYYNPKPTPGTQGQP